LAEDNPGVIELSLEASEDLHLTNEAIVVGQRQGIGLSGEKTRRAQS
jgi:hypothetical protein